MKKICKALFSTKVWLCADGTQLIKLSWLMFWILLNTCFALLNGLDIITILYCALAPLMINILLYQYGEWMYLSEDPEYYIRDGERICKMILWMSCCIPVTYICMMYVHIMAWEERIGFIAIFILVINLFFLCIAFICMITNLIVQTIWNVCKIKVLFRLFLDFMNRDTTRSLTPPKDLVYTDYGDDEC